MKRKRLKLRTRLVPVAGFYVRCALHPTGGHDVIVYGYARRRKPKEWWPARWRRLAPVCSSQASTSAHKHIFYKFVDYKWCPHNTRQDRQLHRSAHMLGLPTCRYALQQLQPPAGIAYLATDRATAARAFLDRMLQQRFPGYENVMLFWGTVRAIACTKIVRMYMSFTFQGAKGVADLFVDPVVYGHDAHPPCEFTIARLPVSVAAIMRYVQRFILADV